MNLIIPISRIRRLIYSVLYLCFAFSIVQCQDDAGNSDSQSSPTRHPQNFVTGKLNQFNGFYTPRPLPDNANFVYASIWASWSAWSFCANNVQIRVRACNTVRGFTCPGANQERKPCGAAAQKLADRQRHQRINGGDYDAVDPWEEDRREALKQLYSDYTPPDEPQRPPAPPLRGLGKSLKPGGDFAAVQRSSGKTVEARVSAGVNGYGNAPLPPPEGDFHRKFHSDGTGQAPSMTPELLFGSKLEIPAKRIKSSSSESKEQKLESISAERKESPGSKSKSIEDITDDKSLASADGNQDPQNVGREIPQLPENIGEGKAVPSIDGIQNPLKMGMNSHPQKPEGDVASEGETEPVEKEVGETNQEHERGEIFGEASVTDILSKIEVFETTPISITETLAEGEELPQSETGTVEELPTPATPLSETDKTPNSDSTPEVSHIMTNPVFAVNSEVTNSEQPGTLNPEIPPHSETPPPNPEVDGDDSDLMSPPPPHFEQPRIRISPSQSAPPPPEDPPQEFIDEQQPEESGPLPRDEMYDDQFVSQNTRTTLSPEDKIKQLENDMDALESQITAKLHSGEVSFNKDTEKALEWMLANMTKAAEEAAARQAKVEEQQHLKAKHFHAPPLHSGEVTLPKEEHSGELKGIFGKAQVIDAKQFGAKISPLDSPITLRKIQPEVQKQHFNHLKYQHAKIIKPIEYKVQPKISPETELLEEDLKKLRSEMARMQSELVALAGDEDDTSIVEVKDRTTISPNLKAINLELVPKAPKPIGGPNVPVVSASGVEGEMFLLDILPDEKGEAQWSEWKKWGDCFCDKQIRTRSCNYDSGSHSKGCQGKSFESRPCITSRPCPAKVAAAKRLLASTTPKPSSSNGLYTLAPQKGPRTGYAFQPNPLSGSHIII